ncbi:winged helix-turn-helix domain-containing protein [Serratia marcescens]|uniref:winged helix-turn-helix domain-containing protein n=1 Tax=Serratia marcescens TaxID=615 RepID=UPI00148B7E8F|nr:transcriptional regulator [Serratia marcescens]
MPCYDFGDYTISENGELFYQGEDVTIPPKELALLKLFAKSQGSILSKDFIIEELWYGTSVSDESLTRCIYGLRRVLGKHKHYIKTFYSRGYKFTPHITVRKKPIKNIEGNWDASHSPMFITQAKKITYSVTYRNRLIS